jgi:uncharacterized membrane protein
MKRFFFRGLFAVLPLALTTFVVWFVFGFLYGNIGVPLGEGLKWAMAKFAGWAPEQDEHAWFFRWGAPFLGFAVGIVVTLVAGFFLATFFGKRIWQVFERGLKKLPVVGTIYPYARQFTEFFLSDDEHKMEFKLPVAVPFPTQGMYSIAFITGDGMKSLDDALKKHMVCVFVPTSPTPFTGYVVYVAREDVIPLPLTVEEAMRIIISAGVIHPGHQKVSALDIPGAAARPIPEALAKHLPDRPS